MDNGFEFGTGYVAMDLAVADDAGVPLDVEETIVHSASIESASDIEYDVQPGYGGNSEGGTKNYNELYNLPTINGVVLAEDKVAQELGLVSEADLEELKDYEFLDNTPSIEGVRLIKDKTFEDLGLYFMTNTEIENLLS